MADAARLAHRVQLSTDGLAWYLSAVENDFGWNNVDCAQLVKTYGVPLDENARQRRYSPMECTGSVKTPVMGNPDVSMFSTSYVERANLTISMGMRRMTRLTNGFSKKAENHAHAFAIHAMFYNFCRPHQKLTKAMKAKTTPAMDYGLTDRVWTVEDVFTLMDPARLLH